MVLIKPETKSNWECVSESLKHNKPIKLGPTASHNFYEIPQKMLDNLTCYKFAAKLIGKEKRVLEVTCNEGFGTFLLGTECGFAKGIDSNENALQLAIDNFQCSTVEFDTTDYRTNQWDAIVSFEDPIFSSNFELFFKQFVPSLTLEGIMIVSILRQEIPNAAQRLRDEMSHFFTHVFLFSAYEEVIQAGDSPLSNRLLAVGSKRRDG